MTAVAFVHTRVQTRVVKEKGTAEAWCLGTSGVSN